MEKRGGGRDGRSENHQAKYPVFPIHVDALQHGIHAMQMRKLLGRAQEQLSIAETIALDHKR
jgi:hypothetical protein